MTIHQYLMQACKDDARRAGERDRVLLEARRVGLIRRPGAGLATLVTRGVRLLALWTGRAQDRLGKPDKPDQSTEETIMHRKRPAPDNERLGRRPARGLARPSHPPSR